jgi:hypothetical protein
MWYAWERREKCTRFWCKSPLERDYTEDRGVDGRMGSKWTLGKLAASVEWIQLAQVDSVSLGYGSVTGSCEYGDELSSSGPTELVRSLFHL